MQETPVKKSHWRRDRLPTPVFLGYRCGSAGKESACNAGNLGSIPRLGRSPGERGHRIPKSMSLLHFKSQLPHRLCLHNFALPVALLHHESTAVPCVKLDSPGDVWVQGCCSFFSNLHWRKIIFPNHIKAARIPGVSLHLYNNPHPGETTWIKSSTQYTQPYNRWQATILFDILEKPCQTNLPYNDICWEFLALKEKKAKYLILTALPWEKRT